MLNPIDKALQTMTPTIMVPRHHEFEPLATNGHRFLVASDGLWLEARRPWLYLCWPLVKQQQVAMPYGTLKPQLDVTRVPPDLVQEFVEVARAACPLECAAWIVWNSGSNVFRLVELPATKATHASVHFQRPRLEENEHLLLDLHSHGRIPAFFSEEDNRDDRGEFKLAGVFGRLNGAIDAEFRLCANGLYVPLGDQRTALARKETR